MVYSKITNKGGIIMRKLIRSLIIALICSIIFAGVGYILLRIETLQYEVNRLKITNLHLQTEVANYKIIFKSSIPEVKLNIKDIKIIKNRTIALTETTSLLEKKYDKLEVKFDYERFLNKGRDIIIKAVLEQLKGNIPHKCEGNCKE
jgi:hypothetical protein